MSICSNCGQEGEHFVGPSLGEPGFFTCKPSCGQLRKALAASQAREARMRAALVRLKDVAMLSQESVCRSMCPTTWPTGTPFPHDRVCTDLNDAIIHAIETLDEQARAALADQPAAQQDAQPAATGKRTCDGCKYEFAEWDSQYCVGCTRNPTDREDNYSACVPVETGETK